MNKSILCFFACFLFLQTIKSQTVEMLTPTGKEQLHISTKYALVVDKYNTNSCSLLSSSFCVADDNS
jgi:hypothetical protein